MKDLISILARNAGIEKTELESAIDKLAFSIRDSLENNPRVSIQGLGTFVAVQEEFELKCDAPINYAGTVLVRESVTGWRSGCKCPASANASGRYRHIGRLNPLWSRRGWPYRDPGSGHFSDFKM